MKLKQFAAGLSAKEETKVEAKMPKVEAPKDAVKKFNAKFASREEKQFLDLAWAVKTLRGDKGIQEVDIEHLKALAASNQKTATVTTDLVELIPSGPSGELMRDVWFATSLSAVVPYKEVVNTDRTDALEDGKLNVYIVGEGVTGTDSNSTYTKMRYEVTKFMGITRATYESVNESIVDIAAEKLADLRKAFAEEWENALVNGDNTVAGHMDATDIYGNAITAAFPIRAFKGIRHLGITKESVDFGGAAMTDQQFITKVQTMQYNGGKYLNKNAVARGEVALFVDFSVYQRMQTMDAFVDASKAGKASTLAGGAPVDTFMGIPVIVLDFMPQATNATGVIDAVGANNIYQSMIMANTKMLIAYSKQGSMVSETDRDITNQTLIWTLSSDVGFNGLYDRTDSIGTVDTARKYVVAGVDINVTPA